MYFSFRIQHLKNISNFNCVKISYETEIKHSLTFSSILILIIFVIDDDEQVIFKIWVFWINLKEKSFVPLFSKTKVTKLIFDWISFFYTTYTLKRRIDLTFKRLFWSSFDKGRFNLWLNVKSQQIRPVFCVVVNTHI